MHPTVKTARLAGALYVAMGVIAPFSIMYVPKKLIVSGDAAATAESILGSEMLFRLGIAGELVSGAIFIFLVMALYRLLSGVIKSQARLMVGMVLVSVAITFVNTLNHIAALILLRGGDYLAVFDQAQREGLAYFFLRMYSQGSFVNELFWGLWLFPFGLLVYKSRFLPRILGILLLVNGVAYVALSLTWLLLPEYGGILNRYAMPALLGEVWIMLWLLIRGVKVQAPAMEVA
jgi:hypothetical protein